MVDMIVYPYAKKPQQMCRQQGRMNGMLPPSPLFTGYSKKGKMAVMQCAHLCPLPQVVIYYSGVCLVY